MGIAVTSVRPPGSWHRRLFGSPAAVVGAILMSVLATVAVLNERIAPGFPFATSDDRLQGPSRDHLMGTDQLGRDLFTGVVRGAHTSLSVVLGVAVISAAIGLLLGSLAGFRGGLVDDLVMRFTEIVQTVPRFFLAVLVVGWFGTEGATLTVLLGLTSWPLLARVVRAETLSLRERDFVRAARAHGASTARIVGRHVLPHVVPTAAIVLALIASRVVLLEAGLAFLGLSDANVMSWGRLVNNAQPYLATAWWMSVFPGAAIAMAVLGMNLLADGFNDLFGRPEDEGRPGTAAGVPADHLPPTWLQ